MKTMNDKILQEVKQQFTGYPRSAFGLSDNGECGKYYCEDEVNRLANAYHERMKREEAKFEIQELVSVAYQANNHARQMVNKFAHNDSREYNRINKRAKFLADNYADKSAPKIVQSEAKAEQKRHLVELTRLGDEPEAKECFTENDLYYGKDDPSLEDRDILTFLNEKANQYAEERIRKSLEKAAMYATITTKAVTDYDGVRRDFKVVDKDSITSKDNYQ